MRRTVPILDRFWSKVDRGEDGECWQWNGTRDHLGYGKFSMGGRRANGGGDVKAHRFAYELAFGPVDPGLDMDHLCRNPSCVNPAHLEPVTHRVNMLRGNSVSGINARKTHCVRGHELREGNIYWARGGTSRRCRTCVREQQRESRRK